MAKQTSSRTGKAGGPTRFSGGQAGEVGKVGKVGRVGRVGRVGLSGRTAGQSESKTASRRAAGGRVASMRASNGSASGRSTSGSSRSASSRDPGPPRAQGSSDALDVLKAQHREVESLFKQFQRAENDNERFEVAQLICHKLTVHASIEEEIFYPMARTRGRGRGEEGKLEHKVLEALEEHLSVKRLVGDIQAAQVGDERLEAKMSVLKEQVSHHVDEEEDELFPQVRKQVSKEERREIGQQLLLRTGELEAADDAEDAEDAERKESAATIMERGAPGAVQGSLANGSSDATGPRPARARRPVGSHPHQ